LAPFEVEAKVISGDNTSITYHMSFNRLKGRLQTIVMLPRAQA
jgi:hypothetical protein